MTIATEVLSFRRDRSSSVNVLLAMLDWESTATDHRMLMRRQAVAEAADHVLLNVAAHATDAQAFFDESFRQSPPSRSARRRIDRFRGFFGQLRSRSFAK